MSDQCPAHRPGGTFSALLDDATLIPVVDDHTQRIVEFVRSTDIQPGTQATSEESSIIEGLFGDAGMLGDEWRIEEANRRLQLVQTYKTLKGEGMSGQAAAK